jgi:uncharacterized membrane protein (UPF0127 family)
MHNSDQFVSHAVAHDCKAVIARAGYVCIHNLTSCSTVAASVLVADTPWSRRRGLLGRPKLEAHEGLWIVPCESVHTVGMNYSIDLLYLNRRRQAIKIVESLAPRRVSLCLRAHSVIELAAGTLKLSGTMIGHQLMVSPLPGDSQPLG